MAVDQQLLFDHLRYQFRKMHTTRHTIERTPITFRRNRSLFDSVPGTSATFALYNMHARDENIGWVLVQEGEEEYEGYFVDYDFEVGGSRYIPSSFYPARPARTSRSVQGIRAAYEKIREAPLRKKDAILAGSSSSYKS